MSGWQRCVFFSGKNPRDCTRILLRTGWPDQKVKNQKFFSQNQKMIRKLFCKIRNKSESIIFYKLVGIMLTCWCPKLCRVSLHLLILYFQRYFTIKKDNTMNICLVNPKQIIEDTYCRTFSLKLKLIREKKNKKQTTYILCRLRDSNRL